MAHASSTARLTAILSALAAIAGVLMIGISFWINPGPPPGASAQALADFARQYYAQVLWGAWLQAVGPVLIVFFALAIVHLGGAAQRLSGWMTMLGAVILMIVSLVEIVFYITALFASPDVSPMVSLNLIHAVQHLYFIVAGPALFIPLGIVVATTRVLPRALGLIAIAAGLFFLVLGITSLLQLELPAWVTAMGAVQALWWLAAAIFMLASGGAPRTPAR